MTSDQESHCYVNRDPGGYSGLEIYRLADATASAAK